MADWAKMRREYIKGGISYRQLAAKYKVSFNTLQLRAKAEGWVELRRQAHDKAVTKTVDAVAEQNGAVESGVYDAAMELLDAFRASVRMNEELSAAMLRDYGAALKSIQAVLTNAPTELDIREQEARIANLRRQAEREDTDKSITVTITGEAEDYAN